METDCFSDSNADTSLPLSSVRLLVPPLRLACAAMWRMTQRGETMHYGKLEEFVTSVTDTVPELMSCDRRLQLIQGLRTRFVLELCRGEHVADPQTAQACVDRIRTSRAPRSPPGVNAADGESSDAEFLELVQSLLKDPARREHFFQEVFPVEFGPKYDAALQLLVWEFLSRLEALLPVPDFTQTASLLSAAPAGLEECVQFAPHQQQLKTLLQHQKCFGQFTANAAVSSTDGCIDSSLSLPTVTGVAIASEQAETAGQSEPARDPVTVSSPSLVSKGAESECLIDGVDYAEVEVELRTSAGWSQDAEEREEEEGAEDGGMEPEDGETENNGLSEGNEDQRQDGEDPGLGAGRENETNGPGGANETDRGPQTGGAVAVARARARTRKEASVTRRKSGNSLVIALKCLPGSQEKGKVNGRRRFSHRNGNADWTLEANARVFACSECLVFHSDEGYIHQHIKTAHPEEYKEFVWAGERKTDPPPSSTTHPDPAPNHDHAPSSAPSPAPENPAKPETSVPRTHACSLCGKSFKSPSDRTRHERTHTGERPFGCPDCAKRFITAWDLTRHRRTHAPAAERPFRRAPAPARPDADAPARRYGCRRCAKTFDSLLERSRHRRAHAVRRQHKCPQCDKTYTRPSDVRRHQRGHTGERPYRCALCGKTFRSATGEKKHQQTHTGERPFPCAHCGKRFTRLPILARHERIHTGERPYLCSKCGKSFLSLGELSKHGKCHTEERPYLCAHCGKGFKREGTLVKHRRTHTGERPYRCSRCDKTFTDRSGLSRHELSHTGERPFGCPQCAKAFLSSGELLKHLRFHTGERPFACELCGKSFTQSCYLKRHQRSHTGERPYACAECRKTFPCSTQLKRHARAHAEEKPFRCPECGKGFGQAHLMKAHQQTHAVVQS